MNEVDLLLSSEDQEQIVSEWLEFQERERDNAEQIPQVVFQVQRLVLSRPDDAWSVLIKLISRAWTSWQATMIGAGPLEDFLTLYQESYIDELEQMQNVGSYYPEIVRAIWIDEPSEKAAKLRLLQSRADLIR